MPSYAKGRIAPPNLAHLRQLSSLRNRHRFRALLAVPPPAQFDCRKLGWVGPVKDQSNCGSCWNFSGTGVVEGAYNKAGIGGGPTVFILSEQYTLDCGDNGGCNGDDNTTVLDWAKSHGLPLTTAYGPYEGGSQRCAYKSTEQLYKINDWGFADSNGGDGITSVADIKAAMMAYGPIGCAIAADDAFENLDPSKVFVGKSRSINHDVELVGWDDTQALSGHTTAWILRNSWGEEWGGTCGWDGCKGGYCWIADGANQVGTEAVFAVVNDPSPAPIPPPTPIPPSPIPGPPDPPPPIPGPIPVPDPTPPVPWPPFPFGYQTAATLTKDADIILDWIKLKAPGLSLGVMLLEGLLTMSTEQAYLQMAADKINQFFGLTPPTT